MRIIQKTEIANSLLLEYLAELSQSKDKLALFQKKYASEFSAFEKEIKSSKKENFNFWDDYIEWKSYFHLFNDLTDKIKDIRSGNFKVA